MTANKATFRILLKLLGLAVCIIPPVISILLYFPLWRSAGAEKMLSGGVLLMVAIAHAPLLKWLKSSLSSISGYTVWFLIFVAFVLLSAIADEMKVISFVGFTANVLGGIILRISEKMGDGYEREGEA